MRRSSDTNWNRMKREKCYSSKYISSVVGVDVTTVNSWLGGRSLPNNKHMEQLCNMFGISQSAGRKMFEADRMGVVYSVSDAESDIALIPKSAVSDEVTSKRTTDIKDILGKFIDFEVDPSAIYMFLTEYKQCNGELDAVLLNIYGKIEALDYQKIYRIVSIGT